MRNRGGGAGRQGILSTSYGTCGDSGAFTNLVYVCHIHSQKFLSAVCLKGLVEVRSPATVLMMSVVKQDAYNATSKKTETKNKD